MENSEAYILTTQGLQRSQELFWMKMMTALAITQLVIGGSCVAFHLAAFYANPVDLGGNVQLTPVHFVAQGLLVGGVVMFTGILGIAASRKRGCTFILPSFLLMSCLSGVLALFIMVLGIMGATSFLGESLNLMMPICQLVLATVEIIVATWSVGISAQTICCPNSVFAQSANQMMGGNLMQQFVTTEEGHHVVIFSTSNHRRRQPLCPYSNGQTPLLVQQGIFGLPIIHPGLMPYQALQSSTSMPPGDGDQHKPSNIRPNSVVGAMQDSIEVGSVDKDQPEEAAEPDDASSVQSSMVPDDENAHLLAG